MYSSTATGLPQLWIADVDGGNVRQLTSTPGPAFSPWSTPDGKWIYFASGARQGTAIFRIAPDGTGLQQVTTDGDARNPIVSPDGTVLYYVAFATGMPRTMKTPIAGGKADAVSPAYFRANDISSDGARLLGFGWSQEKKRPVVATMNLADTTLTEIPGLASGTYFLPDSGLVAAQRVQGKSVITIRPAKEKAFRPMTPPSAEFVLAGAVSRDGRIAFARGTQISDVVLIRAK